MRFLIESFYRSIIEDRPLPIPYREILLTSRIMDSIFRKFDPHGIVSVDGLPTLEPMDPLSVNCRPGLARG